MVSVPADNLISLPSAIFFASKEGKRKKAGAAMKLSDVVKELKHQGVDEESLERFTPALESGRISSFRVASVAEALKSLGKQ